MRRFRVVFVVIATLVMGTSASCARAGETIDSSKIEPDVVYGHKDGLAMTMDVLRPEGKPNRAGIAFMVSGGWFSQWSPPERMRLAFHPYLKKGYTVFLVRHGSSPRYGISDAVADVRRAVRFIHRNAGRWGVDSDRLGVMGMSAGGHLSLMLGTTGDDGKPDAKDELDKTSSRVAAVVALVPPTDLRVAVWSAPETLPAYRQFPALDLAMDKAKENSPLVQVTPDDAPTLVIMGGADDLVPAKHGRWIADAFEREHVPHKLVVVPDAGHGLGGPKNQIQVVGETIAWFDKYLLEKP